MRRTLLNISLLAAVCAVVVPELSSAQQTGVGSAAQSSGSGIVDSRVEKIGHPGLGPGGAADIVSPRDVVAVSKDRVWLQNSLRRRWEAAGPEERNKMLDVQRKLSQSKMKTLSDVNRDELLRRVDSRAMLPRAIEQPVISQGQKPAAGGPIMSLDQRRVLRERIRDLSPEQRQVVRDRMTELRALDDVDQAILRDQLQSLVNLPQEDRSLLDSYRERWESMTPEQQDAMRMRMLRLHEMSAEDRQELLQRAIGDRPEELP